MMTIRSQFLLVLRGLAILLVCSAPLAAQETERVAAVVNDDIITLHDLEQRMRLALASSNLPDTLESRTRIGPQVLRGLVDDRLKTQEAKRLKITVAPAEIANSINNIERQNRMPPGAFEPFLQSKGIELETLRQQINAEMSWVRVVRHELIPDLHVGEAEIDARLATLKANLGKPEYLVAEIFLSVDDPRRDTEVRTLAERLIEQMRQGAPFPALARQFSQTGAAGGDLGWVSQGSLDDELTDALAKLDKGNITPPIRTVDGYHIMLLRDKRIAGQSEETEPFYDIMTIQLPILPGSTPAERDAQLQQVRDVIASGKSCDDYEQRLKQNVATAEYNRNAKVRRSEIPPAIAALVLDLKQGQLSQPMDDGNVRRLFTVCGRIDPKGGLPSRDEIRTRLEDDQMDIMARRYLRDLRRAAFVEIRV
ncbi:peptidylprolyl isomerase [Telmatospirillum siberiense]|uniref:Parvulin-like PPIase n=1 Tax=Telmatospirillum siberiense TaxID=382514 RepID=A0A2N3Q088_9PROT|nr:peptidylprolyl isomerase [Telmatospirillum siberiense]PKU26070.1 parvulin peptidyl-prolyl isomerase [Telmatospirillum siberiense]